MSKQVQELISKLSAEVTLVKADMATSQKELKADMKKEVEALNE